MYKMNYSLRSVISFVKQAFIGLVFWNTQACVNIMPSRKHISEDLKETILDAYQPGRIYKAISKQFKMYQSTEDCKLNEM